MDMAIKKMEKPLINIPDALNNFSIRVEIFIWERNYK